MCCQAQPRPGGIKLTQALFMQAKLAQINSIWLSVSVHLHQYRQVTRALEYISSVSLHIYCMFFFVACFSSSLPVAAEIAVR